MQGIDTDATIALAELSPAALNKRTPKSPKSRKSASASKGRRETADTVVLADLMSQIEKEDEGTSNRRQTVDPSDFAGLLKDIENQDNSTLSMAVPEVARRLTADGDDIADIMLLMKEQEEQQSQNDDSMDDSCGSGMLADILKGSSSDSGSDAASSFASSKPSTPMASTAPSSSHEISAQASRSSTSRIATPSSTQSKKTSNGHDIRRQTADPEDMASLLKWAEESEDTATVSSAQVAAAQVPNSTAKVFPLRSCLSTTKKPRGKGLSFATSTVTRSVSKSVVFGSPNVAEFHKTSPATSYTPLSKATAKSLFPINGNAVQPQQVVEEEEEDEETEANSRVLDEWERLSNSTCNNSDDDVDNKERNADDLNSSLGSVAAGSMPTTPNQFLGGVTGDDVTVELEDNLASVLTAATSCPTFSPANTSNIRNSNSRRSSIASTTSSSKKYDGRRSSGAVEEEDDCTVGQEGNLHAMLGALQEQHRLQPTESPAASLNSTPTTNSTGKKSSRPSSRRSSVASSRRSSMSAADNENTVNLEGSLLDVMQQGATTPAGNANNSFNADTEDNTEGVTVALETNLVSMLQGLPSAVETPEADGESGRKRRKSTTPSRVSSVKSSPASTESTKRRRKSMIQPMLLDEAEAEPAMNASSNGLMEGDSGCTTLAMHLQQMEDATSAPVNISTSSTTTTSSSRRSSSETLGNALGTEFNQSNLMFLAAAATISANTSTCNSSVGSEAMRTQLSMYAVSSSEAAMEHPVSTDNEINESMEVDDEISFKIPSGRSSVAVSNCNSAAPSPAKMNSSQSDCSRNTNNSSSLLTPAGTNEISVIRSSFGGDNVNVLNSSRRNSSVENDVASVAATSYCADSNGNSFIVTEQHTIHGMEVEEDEKVSSTCESTPTGSNDQQDRATDLNASGYYYANRSVIAASSKEDDVDSSGVGNVSVIAPLVSTAAFRNSLFPVSNNNNRVSFSSNATGSTVNCAMSATSAMMDESVEKATSLLKKVQSQIADARRQSMAQMTGVSNNRFSICNSNSSSNRMSLMTRRTSLVSSATPAVVSAGSNAAELRKPRFSIAPNFTAGRSSTLAASIAATAAIVQETVETVNDALSSTMVDADIPTNMSELLNLSTNANEPVAVSSAASPAHNTMENIMEPISAAKPTVQAADPPALFTAALDMDSVKENNSGNSDSIREAFVNSISYCRITQLTSQQIDVEVVLTANVRVQLVFYLEQQQNAGVVQLVVSNMDIELINLGADDSNETKLAFNYFAMVMCNDKCNGPLSERFLSENVVLASDIPSALHTITGYIVTLRLMVANLDKWCLGNGSAAACSWQVSGTNKTCVECNGVTLPLSLIISNQCNIEALMSL